MPDFSPASPTTEIIQERASSNGAPALALAEAGARQFGRIVRRNWYAALLVASCAERAEPGRRSDLAENPPGSKLSLRRFAELAECDRATAARYLDAWERAAAAGLVPAAATLKPGQEVDLAHLDAKLWERFYAAPLTRAARVDRAAAAIRAVEARRPPFRPPEAHIQLARYLKLMHKFPPTHPEGCWRPEGAGASATALVREVGKIPAEALSARRRAVLAARLRKEADRLQGKASGGKR